MSASLSQNAREFVVETVDMQNKLHRFTSQYLLFSALAALYLYVVLYHDSTVNMLNTWIVCLEANTAVLAIFNLLSNKRDLDARDNHFFMIGIMMNAAIWGVLGGVILADIPNNVDVLVLLALVAVVGLGVPVVASSNNLVALFSSLILLPPAIHFISQFDEVSLGKGVTIALIIPVILRMVSLCREFIEKAQSLQDDHKTLIDRLNMTIKKSELANTELRNEIENKQKTEAALITARDQAQEAALTKSEFLATMSHEIRTPMNGILGMTEMLKDTELSSKQKRFADTIHKSGNTLLNIINEILDFSKIEAGKLELNYAVFDLRELIEDIAVLFAEQAGSKGLTLNCEYPASGHATFRGDAQRIRQILVNLIGNAIKFTERGEIIVRIELFETQSENINIRFRVTDTGIGIPQSAQEKIFDSFSQADGSTTRKFGGTGLGLSISKKLTLLMNGKIGLKSAPSEGSTFWFAIPLKKEKAINKPLSAQIAPAIKQAHILIADQNATTRHILEKQCENWKIRFQSVSNGTSALKVIQQANELNNPIDLAIVENDLPSIDAISLAKKVKGNAKIADTKLVILSSVGNMEETGQWMMAGVDSYLNKPIRQNEMYEALYKALVSDTTSVPPPMPTEASQPVEEGKLRGHILVAEDNFVNQELIREMLTKLGLSFEIAGNGRLAFEALTECPLDKMQRPYNLVLMDCQMPEMDGFAATRSIREWEAQQRTIERLPIIALTANAMEGDRERCLVAGMDDYMTKPINLEQLSAMLHRWLPLLSQDNKSEFARLQTAIEEDEARKAQAKKEASTQVTQLDQAALDKVRKLQRKGQPNVLIKVSKLFLENSEKLIRTLETAAANGDGTALQRAAYSMQSSCKTVGASDLATLCSELEVLAMKDKINEAQARLSVLEYEYDAVCHALQDLVKRESVTV